MTLIVLEIKMKKIKERSKTSNEIITVDTIISLIYIICSRVSLLEQWQNNLSNPETYSELCQISEMEFLACQQLNSMSTAC